MVRGSAGLGWLSACTIPPLPTLLLLTRGGIFSGHGRSCTRGDLDLGEQLPYYERGRPFCSCGGRRHHLAVIADQEAKKGSVLHRPLRKAFVTHFGVVAQKLCKGTPALSCQLPAKALGKACKETHPNKSCFGHPCYARYETYKRRDTERPAVAPNSLWLWHRQYACWADVTAGCMCGFAACTSTDQMVPCTSPSLLLP